jgi:23S rRNA pseudouridine1911/1915/1917 synthase
MPQIFRVLPAQENQTIAAALRHWLPGKSWGEIRRLMEGRHVLVSGNLCVDAGRRLNLQDVIKVLDEPTAAPPKAEDIRIRHLDEHVVVVEKPTGLTSNRHHEELSWPAKRRQLQPTLDELLPGIIARLEPQKRGKGVPRPVRPVHRLDRETSGLMVFARTIRAERHLGEQFRSHTTHRRYLAIVEGTVEAQTIAFRLIRDRGDGRRGVTPRADLGKHAVTHVRPLENFKCGYTLVECQLETGRTHQIRIHLSERGHPVCGEKVYRPFRHGKTVPDKSGAPRLALHAAEIGFVHPMTGENIQFTMPLPKDLQRFLDAIRAK